MYSVEFIDADGGVRERVVIGLLLDADAAEQEAKRLLDGVKLRNANVVDYRVLNNGVAEAGARS